MTAATAAATTPRAGLLARGRRFASRHRLVGLVFILPWLVSFLWLDVYPLLSALYLSGTDYSVGRKLPNWIGVANYVEMFTTDRLIGVALYNTLYYVALQVPLALIAGFTLALMLNVRIKGTAVFRTLYYVPAILPGVAGSVLWLWLLNGQRGLVNQVLGLFGIAPINWLTSPQWTKPALILMALWGVGGAMVIFLAGLQGVARDYYEAAAIDGAGPVRRLGHITIPLMTPTIFFNLVMGIIGALQVFSSAFIMTGSGPLNSTLFFMIHIYNNAFNFYRMGYAAALSVVLFIVILALTLLVNSSSGRWVHYE